MCGIAGIYNKKNTIDQSVFDEMVDIIKHRGPDGRGTVFECDNHLAIGHRRLAIIEPNETGAQPFCYDDRYIVTYNGEIYNYIELREELDMAGYVFKTKTDTEVLVASYSRWGEECVKRFNGMWSFAIYDREKETLFCSRDRFGIKPFYYYRTNEIFAFGSEIKQLLCLNEIEAVANEDVLLTYLMIGEQDYSEETMFKDIMCLLPGHSIHFDIKDSIFNVYRYHNLSDIIEEKHTFEEDCKAFYDLFMDSVRLRLRSDVPVGYCLSGGLDSSSIVCCADKILSECNGEEKQSEQHTVSSCFEDPDYDEKEYIEEVVKNTSVISHKVYPDINKVLEETDKIIWHMDEPFGSTSIYSQWNVFREAKKHGLTVMLDGQGADEQLAGYSFFYSVRFTELIKKFKLIQLFREIRQYHMLRAVHDKDAKFINVLLASGLAVVPIPDFIKTYIRRKREEKKNSFFTKEQIKRVYEQNRGHNVSDTRGYIVSSVYGGMQALLHYEDRDSMAFSIESRVPFLDYKLVERVFSMPFNRKIRNGITKAVLREGMRGVLPDKIRERYSKLGFASPEDKWMNENEPLIENELRKSCEVLSPMLDPKSVIYWFKNSGGVKRGNPIVWRIMCVGRWVNVYNVTMKKGQ